MQILTDKLLSQRKIIVRGVEKSVKGMARFATINFPEGEYVKVSFTDGSGIYYMLGEEAIYYVETKLGVTEGITDEMIGRDQKLTYKGVEFTGVNLNDYQFVKEFYIGIITDLEGEVKFSDYSDVEGNTLSLGWDMYTGKRADVYAVPIKLADIT